MSLNQPETKALSCIADGLAGADPRLASMLTIFSRLAADMAGATIINATVLHNTTFGPNVWLTAVLCAACALLAYGRRQQIKGLGAATRR